MAILLHIPQIKRGGGLCYEAFSFLLLHLWFSSAIIVSDNDLAPNRLQAIIWTNDGLIYSHIYASLGFKELNFSQALHVRTANNRLVDAGQVTICIFRGTYNAQWSNARIVVVLHQTNKFTVESKSKFPGPLGHQSVCALRVHYTHQ